MEIGQYIAKLLDGKGGVMAPGRSLVEGMLAEADLSGAPHLKPTLKPSQGISLALPYPLYSSPLFNYVKLLPTDHSIFGRTM